MAEYLSNLSRRTEPLFDVQCPSLCESCGHCIVVTDRAKSREGRLRVLEVCVADHDEGGEDWGDIITEPVRECARWQDAEGSAWECAKNR